MEDYIKIEKIGEGMFIRLFFTAASNELVYILKL